ncbi:MAG TPA: flavoprotein [Polyangiaceae bacterium]|nr:flavoprotein [Polyangiaceae bacterium]
MLHINDSLATKVAELCTPCTLEELTETIAARAGSRQRLSVVEEVLALLRAAGVVVEVPRAPPGAPSVAADAPLATRQARVLLALGGGIAAAFSPLLVELLVGRGHGVRAVATPSALRFVRRLPLEALTHAPVPSKLWPSSPTDVVPHLALARWADVTVLYPATATTLSRIARGDCSTLVSAAAISTRGPVILVPTMNEAMLHAPSVQRNLEQLRGDGFLIMHPSIGYEVAEAPERRAPAFGAAPPLQYVVDVIESVLGGLTLSPA